jgi:hypothetical protein
VHSATFDGLETYSEFLNHMDDALT